MSHGNAKRVKAHPFQKKGEENQDVAAPQDDDQNKKPETAAEMLQRLQDKTKEAAQGAATSPKKDTQVSPVPSAANVENLKKAIEEAKEAAASKKEDGADAKKEEAGIEKEHTRFGRVGLSSTKAPRQMLDAGMRQSSKLGFAEGSSDAKWEKLTIEVMFSLMDQADATADYFCDIG